MNIARLGAASAAAVVVALGAAAPAFATGTTPPPPPGGGVSKDAPSAPTDQKPGENPSADVNPKFFYGGDTLTWTVKNCTFDPVLLDVNHLFVTHNPFVPTGEKGSFAAKETTRKDLVDGKQYKVIVKCGKWTDTFTTKPHKKPKPTPTPTTQPTGVPSGAPQTGDGSSAGGGNAGLIAGGAGVVIVGLAGGAFLYTRRRSSAGA